MSTDADAIVGLYQKHARAFAQRRNQTLFERAWLDRFLELAPERPSILDLGCGSGSPIARYLIGRGCDLCGVDTSPQLLAMCRDTLPQGDWRLADMRDLALERVFDGILAWNSCFHLRHEDQRQLFSIFAKHAGANAVLMFTSGPAHGEALGECEGETLYHASLDAAEYRALLAAHGFQVVAHAVEDPGCGGHTIWLARRA